MPIQQTEKEVVYKKIHDEIPMNATYKTRVIFTGNSPVLVLIWTIDMTFIVCTADHLIQVLIFMTVKSFLIFTTCLKKCLDTTYIYLLITITHGRHIFLIHSTHMILMHTQQTELRSMCRFLGIFAYTPGVICSNKYHTSYTYISFPQHAHEFLIYVISKKTFVRCTSSLFGTHGVDNRHK